MTLSEFFSSYKRDIRPTVAVSTWEHKESLFRAKIEPYLGLSFIERISSQDVLYWQELMRNARKRDGTSYSQTYLRSFNNQIEAIFNHAVSNYGLRDSPTRDIRKMGKKRAGEMRFWTKDEYLSFAEQVEDDPVCHCAFEILY